jgi:hypothetical protein
MSRSHIDHIIMVKRELNIPIHNDASDNSDDVDYESVHARRNLRSRYLAVKNMINGGNSILLNPHSVLICV